MEDKSSRIRLFVDMDGTLAKFIPQDTLEPLFEKGYFESLEPMPNVVDTVNFLNTRDAGIDVYILSACLDSGFAEKEKNEWLDKYMPSIKSDQRIFTEYGTDKSTAVPGGVGTMDFLLDDYSNNLKDWVLMGGQGIKALNGINGRNGTWDGPKIDCGKNSLALRYELVSKINSAVIDLHNKELEKNIDKNISKINAIGIAGRKERAVKRSEELCQVKKDRTVNLMNGKER